MASPVRPTLLAFFLAGILFGQNRVETGFTAQELVEDVLVDNSCAETSNFRSFTGSSFGFESIGVFEIDDPEFPFERGIVLSTGRAKDVLDRRGNDFITSGSPNWQGDPDLINITQRRSLFNASFLQFDFVPTTNNISFEFLFASEEYFGEFQCTFSDVFAFILTRPDGSQENLALVPGTQIPVSVTTIRPGIPNSCSPENRNFFGGFNSARTPIALWGQTIPLKVSTEVIPGEEYTIKLVIADNLDPELDSAVFLKAGSFTIDIDLGENRTVASGKPICTGEVIELDATTMGAQGYRWFRNGEELEALKDRPLIRVSDNGIYNVEVNFSAICFNTGEIELEFITPPVIVDPALKIVQCEINGDGKATFDFSENAARILGNQDPTIYQVRFYTNREDAIVFQNAISGNTYENSAPSETIYARISSGISCFEIVEFQIELHEIEIPTLPEKIILCRDANGNANQPLPVLDSGLSTNDFGFRWFRITTDAENQISPEAGPSLTLSEPGTYFLEVRDLDLGCTIVFKTEVIPVDPPETFEIQFNSELFSDDNSITIQATGNADYLFRLNDGPFGELNTFDDLLPGLYVAEVIDTEGCNTVSKTFEIIDYPRYFSPNGDDVNDQWGITSVSNGIQQNAQISIFDRYGQLMGIFAPNEFWDGTFNGRPLPASDYWFRIDYERESRRRTFTAHFSLKR